MNSGCFQRTRKCKLPCSLMVALVYKGGWSMKSKSKPLCCYFHSAYVSVRVVQVPKRGLDLSLLDSPTSTADNLVIFKADD